MAEHCLDLCHDGATSLSKIVARCDDGALFVKGSALANIAFWDLLGLAREQGASDVHISPDRLPSIRVDGATLNSLAHVSPFSSADVSYIARTLSNDETSTLFESRGDVDVTLRHDELGPFRVHVFRCLGRCHLAVRLLANTIPSMDFVTLPPIVEEFSRKNAGLLLFVGPTGSGKTTALAAVVDMINHTRARHIVTIEDPVEYVHLSVLSLRCVASGEVARDVADF